MDSEREKMFNAIIEMLNGDDFKDNFLKEINDEIDIPILNEKKEGKIFKALYKVLLNTLKKIYQEKLN